VTRWHYVDTYHEMYAVFIHLQVIDNRIYFEIIHRHKQNKQHCAGSVVGWITT